MEPFTISNLKLGIISGGQLGKMLSLAAANWNIKTYILDSHPECPARNVCADFTLGDYSNFEDVYNFGKKVDLLTFEIESVNIDAIKKLESEGLKIYPSPKALELIQDKGLQKSFYKKHNLATADFQLFNSKEEILEAIQNKEVAYPFVQKLRKGGYDGRGVAVIKSEQDLNNLLIGGSLIEDCVDIAKEIAVIVARNKDGAIKCFDAVEMEFNHEANLVEKLICPANISVNIESQAKKLAEEIIHALDFVGLLAVEIFIDNNNEVWINEIAPRPHNSGHHTIESVITSQYEQHLRAICNLPLGSTKIKMPSVMINLLGEAGFNGPAKYIGLAESMAMEGVKVHLYGKEITKPFRKMGHVTILSTSIENACEKANFVKDKIKIKS